MNSMACATDWWYVNMKFIWNRSILNNGNFKIQSTIYKFCFCFSLSVSRVKYAWKLLFNDKAYMALYPPNISRRARFGISLTVWPHHLCAPVPSQHMFFKRHNVGVLLFCNQWAKVRGHCPFCFYFWNCCSSLFKFSFHK